MNKSHFRVTIFGSARIKRGDPKYKLVHRLAKMVAKEGLDLVTGGGPGLMDAASRGHKAGRGKNNKDLHSIGLAISLPREQRDAKHLDIKKDFSRFSGRLDKFMELSNVVVVAPGGVGTLLEFFYTWQLAQVKHICETPIILLGSQYDGLLDWLKRVPLKKKLISKEDFSNIFVAKTCTEAISLIKRVHTDSKKPGHICENFVKYRKNKK